MHLRRSSDALFCACGAHGHEAAADEIALVRHAAELQGLSVSDQTALADAILNPPPLTPAMDRAIANHHRSIKRAQCGVSRSLKASAGSKQAGSLGGVRLQILEPAIGECGLLRGGQHHVGGAAGQECFLPAWGAEAPLVAGEQAGEAVFRAWGR